METLPFRLIDEPIEVAFSEPPLFEKKPPCPTSFTWQGENYPIIEVIAEWEDYRRKGKWKRNNGAGTYQTRVAQGILGVGRFYFRVRVKQGNLYEIYFDRAPESAGDRKRTLVHPG